MAPGENAFDTPAIEEVLYDTYQLEMSCLRFADWVRLMFQKAKVAFELGYDSYLENLETKKLADELFGI